MMELFGDPATWLPVAFAGLMGLSILLYVILDGFDLGVGLLMPLAEGERHKVAGELTERDRMVASIGPFWDANETWLILAIGILLVAFPVAHGAILTALYLPVFVMLVGLILRGVAFEFRAKAPMPHKPWWDRAFHAGSLMTALSQGYMLGLYVMGLDTSLSSQLFAVLTGLCVTFGYGFVGACWLVGKTEGALQHRAVQWARHQLWAIALGILAVSVATPLVSPRVFDKWFQVPEFLALAPLPIASVAILWGLNWLLRYLPDKEDRLAWVPFWGASALFALAFFGLAYSFYPYVVPEQMTIYEAAAAPESLFIIFVGTLIVLPIIMGYTALAYVVFRGKATALTYD